MVFSSATFLFMFLPVVLLAYYVVPNTFKNTILLIASLSFYGFGEPDYLYLLVLMCLMNFLFAQGMERYERKAKAILLLSVCMNVLLLGYFKYVDFLLSSIAMAFDTKISLLYIALPMGISFYTFQCISYVIDVYRKQVKASRNLLQFATYVTLFPQLIAGPIVRYVDIEQQLMKRTHSIDGVVAGIERFIIGLAKKVLLANTMGQCLSSLNELEPSVAMYWFAAVIFIFQLYYDFSGYSDMAIGLGKMFGFTFLENFRYPYCATSITDFWRRWHISLSSWFKDYVYIPLKGSRVRPIRLCFNILIVWSLTGLWHGAQWNFILWGLYFAMFLLIEKKWLLPFLKKHTIIAHIYTIFLILIGFTIFRLNVQEANVALTSMLFMNEVPLWNAEVWYYVQSYFVLCVICIIGATPAIHVLQAKVLYAEYRKKLYGYVSVVLYFILFIVSIAFIVDASFQPFLYFRF